MTFETDFFDLCGVCRDRFTRDIKKALDAHKARKSEIERDFKGERAKTEHKLNNERLTEATAAAREKAQKDILEAYEKAEIREKAAVSAVTIGADVIKALDGLRGVPISAEELSLIADGLKNKGYWATAKLRQLASENGVQKLPGLCPTYTERMEVLNLARDRMLDFLESGDVDGLNMNITDRAFLALERAFSGGFKNSKLSAEKQAALILDNAKNCGDPFSTAVYVKNALETSADDVKAEIVKRVSAEDNAYWENVRELGGLGSVLDGIRTEEDAKRKLDEKQALKLVTDARLAGEVAKLSEAERRAALWGSAVYQGDGREARKIDKQGIDFLTTEQGAEKVREFEEMERRASEAVADKMAEARARAEIEG